jgi:hypothetical protein
MVGHDQWHGVRRQCTPDCRDVLLVVVVDTGGGTGKRVDGDLLAVGNLSQRLEDGTLVGRDGECDLDVGELLLNAVEVGLDPVEQRAVVAGVGVCRVREADPDDATARDPDLYHTVEVGGLDGEHALGGVGGVVHRPNGERDELQYSARWPVAGKG